MTSVAWDRREYDRTRHQNRKAELIAYLGGQCAKCGSPDDLEFDHIDPESKSFSIMTRANRGLDALKDELAKCQMLCAGCHAQKTIEAASVDHGGGTSGKRNCQCAPCRERKSEYMRQWEAAHPGRKLNRVRD